MPHDDVTSLAELLASELEAAQLQWSKEIIKVESEMNAKGMLHSGSRMSQTADRLNKGIVLYRKYIFDTWIAYIKPRLPSLSAAERTAFASAAVAALDQATGGAVGQLEGRPGPGLRSSTDFAAPIKETGQRERRRLESEIRLYVSTPVSTPPASIHVSTHGANSPVNMGSGAIHQQVNTAEGMAELVAALRSLLDAMSQMQERSELNEVREIVVEAKDEAGKPVPNMLRLRSILGGIKTGIEGVAVLEKAWELVQQASKALGL
jgi:hypothetical protein